MLSFGLAMAATMKITALCNGISFAQGKLNNALYRSRVFANVTLPNE